MAGPGRTSRRARARFAHCSAPSPHVVAAPLPASSPDSSAPGTYISTQHLPASNRLSIPRSSMLIRIWNCACRGLARRRAGPAHSAASWRATWAGRCTPRAPGDEAARVEPECERARGCPAPSRLPRGGCARGAFRAPCSGSKSACPAHTRPRAAAAACPRCGQVGDRASTNGLRRASRAEGGWRSHRCDCAASATDRARNFG